MSGRHGKQAGDIPIPSTSGSSGSTYDLQEVRRLFKSGDYVINENASQTAWRDFQWEEVDVSRALVRIGKKDFKRKEPSRARPGTMLDVYELRGERGVRIYTHFYIADLEGVRTVIVNSFKKAD